MPCHIGQRLQLISFWAAETREGGIRIVVEHLNPDIHLALMRDTINPKGQAAELEPGAVLQFPGNWQPDLVAIEGYCVLPAMQGHFDGNVLP